MINSNINGRPPLLKVSPHNRCGGLGSHRKLLQRNQSLLSLVNPVGQLRLEDTSLGLQPGHKGDQGKTTSCQQHFLFNQLCSLITPVLMRLSIRRALYHFQYIYRELALNKHLPASSRAAFIHLSQQQRSSLKIVHGEKVGSSLSLLTASPLSFFPIARKSPPHSNYLLFSPPSWSSHCQFESPQRQLARLKKQEQIPSKVPPQRIISSI